MPAFMVSSWNNLIIGNITDGRWRRRLIQVPGSRFRGSGIRDQEKTSGAGVPARQMPGFKVLGSGFWVLGPADVLVAQASRLCSPRHAKASLPARQIRVLGSGF
jgi:hypothetical protein